MEYKHLKPKHGFSINGWMVLDYHLAGNELLAFGLVFSLSQGKAGLYTGGIPFMAEFFSWSPNTCRKYLRMLVAKGLIRERRGYENGVPFCNYQVADFVMETHPSKNEVYPSNFEESPLQNLHPDTLQDLKVNNKGDNNKTQYTPPTPQEVEDYARSQGFADPAGFADYYVRYQTEAGWMTGKGAKRHPIDNWKLNVIAWGRYRKGEIFTTQSETPKATRMMNGEEFDKLFG